MGIYVGVNGVARSVKGIDAGKSGVSHVIDAYVGVNGSVRKAYSILDDIDYVKVKFTDCYLGDGDFSNLSKSTQSTCEQYGSVSISGNCARVYVSSHGYSIGIYGRMYVVFKDGHEVDLRNIVNSGPRLSCRISASYYISGSEGYYSTLIYGTPLFNDEYYGSTSGSCTISSMPSGKWGAIVGAGKYSSYSITCEQTYNNITIDGRSFSMRAENNLP